MLNEGWRKSLGVLLAAFLAVFQSAHAQAASQAPTGHELILEKAGIAFTLSAEYYEYKERGHDGFLFSATDGKGFIFRVALPDSPEVEAQNLTKIQDEGSGFVWDKELSIGNHAYVCYHNPQSLSWYFWLRSSNRSLAYLYFVSKHPADTTIPPEAMRILSSMRILDHGPVEQNQSVHGEILLKDLGIAFTLPDSFTQYDAASEPDNALFASMQAHNGLVFMVRRPDDAATEAYILQKTQSKNSGFVEKEDVKIGENSFFVYHQPLFPGWFCWLRSPKGFVAYLCFVPLEPTDALPPEALDILASLRLVKSY